MVCLETHHMVVVAFAMSHVTKRRASYIHSGDNFYEHCTHIKKKKEIFRNIIFSISNSAYICKK